MFKSLLLTLLATMTVSAQTFYVLAGVDHYDTLVANMSAKIEKYSEDIKSLMISVSKEIGVSTTGHPSSVLYFLISDVSMGDTIGLN